jgi:HK97 gp10 family phage protein
MSKVVKADISAADRKLIRRALQTYLHEMYPIMIESTQVLRTEAIDLMRAPKSGRLGYSRRRSGLVYRRSAAGEAPAVDTGDLMNSIVTDVVAYNGQRYITGEVIATEKYAAALEFGTPKMKARPFMRPALNKATKHLMKKLKNLF